VFPSTEELKSAVDECLKLSHADNCRQGPDGPIWEWDVSKVIDMRDLFADVNLFDTDISVVWDVSHVTGMAGMFFQCKFGVDISKWDVLECDGHESHVHGRSVV